MFLTGEACPSAHLQGSDVGGSALRVDLMGQESAEVIVPLGSPRFVGEESGKGRILYLCVVSRCAGYDW